MVFNQGKTGIVYFIDTSVASTSVTGEAMTDSGDHMRYAITNQAKRYWDPNATITVKVNGTPTSNVTIEACGGNVVFPSSQGAATITVDCSYWPYAKYGQCTKYTFKQKPVKEVTTVLNDQGVRRAKGQDDYEITMEGFHEDSTWFNIAINDHLLAAVLHDTGTYSAASSTGPRHECYAHVDDEISMDVGSFEKDSLSLVSEGQAYYRST